MFERRFSHLTFNLQECFHRIDLTKGNPCLRHAEGAGVHPKENRFDRMANIAQNILFMQIPGIIERVIDNVILGESQRFNLGPEQQRTITDSTGKFHHFLLY